MQTAILSQSDHARAVGHRLRKIAAALEISLSEMSRVMGCSKQNMNDWVNGSHYPSAYAVYRLCRSYGVTFDYLFLGDWSRLPAGLAVKLEPVFPGSPVAPLVPAHQGSETSGRE